jgi:hypothetical protein
MAISGRFNSGISVLAVSGDRLANAITVGLGANDTILLNGGAMPISGDIPTVANTAEIQLLGEAGDDVIVTQASLSTRVDIDGGAGNDTIVRGSGADDLRGGAGNDVVTGGRGNDVVLLGSGNEPVHLPLGEDAERVPPGSALRGVRVQALARARRVRVVREGSPHPARPLRASPSSPAGGRGY